jgi:hypothetical protein
VRLIAALALLVAASPARAAIDACAAERAEAAATPPADEDVRAYQACLDRWRDILPRAEAELAKPPPQHLDACDGPFARWQTAAAVAPENYEAMQRRLAARDEVDRCVRDALTPREPLAVVAARIAAEEQQAQRARDRSEARGWIVGGAILVGVGGVGLTALGAAGLALPARSSAPDYGESVTGDFIFGIMGAACAASAITGALLLGFGARRLSRAR